VRAALCSIAAASADGADEAAARRDLEAATADLEALAAALARALGGDDAGGGRAAWAAAFELLARRAVHGSRMERSVEARALFDVQTACLEGTRTPKTVELAAFLRSLGKKPIVRELPAAREVRVARRLKSASERALDARLPPASKHEVQELLHGLAVAASAHLRGALGPRVEAALVEVGLAPTCAVERVALRSVVAQLLDGVDARGFFSIGQVRDAVSKNALKLPNVTPTQLVKGDAVLRADRRLGEVADGVYREGEIYLRGLQKASSLAFGTKLGRLLTLYVALPFGSSYVALEGVGHLVGAISEVLHGPEIELFNPVSFVLLGAFIFVMLHVEVARRAALRAVRAAGAGLRDLFVLMPRWLAAQPFVRFLVENGPLRTLWRFVVRPLVVAGAAARLARSAVGAHTARGTRAEYTTFGVAFLVASAALNSPAGVLAQELAIDWLSRRFTWLGRQFLPNLFHLVVSLFARLVDSIERGLYAVDEWLRFREGEHPVALVGKVAFGFVWFVVAYVVRLYINLLIEPQVNPIKHFPVVTVGAKIIWPMSRKISHASIHAIMPYVGKAAAVTIVPPTVLALPGVFGFLVWELKENFRLYAQNRAPNLEPVSIGHHGETMVALLRPGLHSGTVPKLFTKLRRASMKQDHAGVAKQEEAIAEVREAVERFVDRRVVALLATSTAWTFGAVTLAHVELTASRVAVALRRAGSDTPLVVAFEEQSGLLCARVAEAGFADDLDERGRVALENALAVLYRLAAVDLAHEAIEAAIDGAAYDVSDDGLVVWPGEGYRTELVYPLTAPGVVAPKVHGDVPAHAPRPLDVHALLLRQHPIAYAAFRDAWETATPTRLEAGAPLLPRRAR
jgi:hypothetical protein